MYHIIDAPRAAAEDKYCCTPQQFEIQMQHLRRAGSRVVSLDTLLSRLDDVRQAQEDTVAVTFDDGFACTYQNALPILLKYQVPATVFMPSDRIGKSNDWMRSHAAAPRALMSVEQLRQLVQAGVVIGSHSRTHPRLIELEPRRVVEEVRGSKASLEQIVGASVDHFAYPYGLYSGMIRDEVEHAGYRAACSTRSGFNRADVDRFLLRRIEVYGSDSLLRFRQKLKFGANDVSPLFSLRYYAGRLAARAGLARSGSRDA